jgi:two-component system, sensor histidine kinase
MDEVEHIRRVASALVKVSTVRETCEIIVKECKVALGADAICLFLPRQKVGGKPDFEMVAELGCTKDFKKQWHRVPADRFPLLKIAAPYEKLFYGSASELKKEIPSTKELVDKSKRKVIGYAPLVVNHKSIGVIGFSYNSVQIAPTNQDFIIAIISLCAQGLERAHLFEREKIARQEAEQANRAKTSFLASISHEIRTPLGVIKGFAELISKSNNLPPTERKWTSRILKNAEHLAGVIGEVLDITKIESYKVEVNKTFFSLQEFIEDLKAVTMLKADEKNITLSFLSSNPLLSVRSDPTHLRQIVINLISNAINFTPKSGKIDVLFNLEDSKLRIEVKDNGVGISATEHFRIFDPFTRLRAAHQANVDGIGLGLTISKRLAEALGGSLYLHESAPNEGSTFVIEIECDSRLSVTKKFKPLKEVRKLDNLKFLLIDDSVDNQVLIEHILSLQGGKVDTAENGRLGVKKALNSDYNLVIMDIQMPEMDGNQAVRELRAKGYNKPIVALTAEALPEKSVKSMRRGFDDYLSKPIDVKRFVHTLARLAQR